MAFLRFSPLRVNRPLQSLSLSLSLSAAAASPPRSPPTPPWPLPPSIVGSGPRISKEGRAAGVLDNFAEGEKYAEHGLRKLVRNRTPEIMPSINKFFADPK